MDALELAAHVDQAVADETMRRFGSRAREAREYVYASGIRQCSRRMALEMMAASGKPVDPAGAARMNRGSERETHVNRLLEDAGRYARPRFEVVEGQLPIKIPDRDGTLLISGRLDGRLKVEGLAHRPPFEVKSGRLAERATRIEDFFRSPWSWSYPYQLLCYLWATNEPFGYLIVDTGGLPRLLPVSLLDWADEAERAVQAVRSAIHSVKALNANAEGANLPPFHPDIAVCKACPFLGGACTPPLDYGEGVGVLTDERIIEALENRAKNREASREYDEADRTLKDLLKLAKFEGRAIAGRFLLVQSWQKQTKYNIPENLKPQFRVVEPKGKYMLEVKEVPCAGEDP